MILTIAALSLLLPWQNVAELPNNQVRVRAPYWRVMSRKERESGRPF